jgi:hypothetical protein
MKKLLITGFLISVISIYGNHSHEKTIIALSILETKIESVEKTSHYNKIFSYSAIFIGTSALYFSSKQYTPLYCLLSWASISGFLTLWSTVELKQCQSLFKKLATKRINSLGDVVDNKYTSSISHLPYLINDDLFFSLGLKVGFSELELIDLAKTLGRLNTAYKLKILISQL